MENEDKFTTAGKYENVFRQLRRDDRNFICEDYTSLLDQARGEAVGIFYPCGRNSSDPSETLRFSDGSELWVDNPRQWAFRLVCYERDFR